MSLVVRIPSNSHEIIHIPIASNSYLEYSNVEKCVHSVMPAKQKLPSYTIMATITLRHYYLSLLSLFPVSCQ